MSHSYKYVDLFQVNKKNQFFYICVFCLKIQIVGLFCCMQKLHKRYLSGVRKHSYNLVHDISASYFCRNLSCVPQVNVAQQQ